MRSGKAVAQPLEGLCAVNAEGLDGKLGRRVPAIGASYWRIGENRMGEL